MAWLATIAIAACASGCGSSQGRLVGTWSAELHSKQGELREVSPLDIGETPAEDFSIRLAFYRDGRLDTVTKLPQIQTQKSGRWRILSFDGASQTALIECDLLQQRTQHEVEFVDARTIRLVPPNLAGLDVKLEFKKAF